MSNSDLPLPPPMNGRNPEEYFDVLQKHIAELRAQGHNVHFEVWNESFHGQAAVNILNGLPPDATPSEVKGCFNDFLQNVLDPAVKT